MIDRSIPGNHSNVGGLGVGIYFLGDRGLETPFFENDIFGKGLVQGCFVYSEL